MSLKTMRATAGAAVVLLSCVMPVSAHSIDYLASAISPAATFNGQSGNFNITNPVSGGAIIQFTLTFSINTQGSTTEYPRTVTFGATPSTGVVIQTPTFKFESASSSFSTQVTITAPTTPGPYSIKIDPTSGTGGAGGLSGGGGVTISFTVAAPPSPGVITVPTELTIGKADTCLVVGQPSVNLTATLIATGGGLSGGITGMTIDFAVDDPTFSTIAGSGVTGSGGLVSVPFNSASLTVGDHTIYARFPGQTTGGYAYTADSDSETLGIKYTFVGFQQPINADGSSVFGGRVVPVKIRIANYSAGPVTNAEARVYFAFGVPHIVGTDAEPVANTNGDSGNLMRYDLAADQYIFNWDVNNLANGTYTVRVGLNEGGCADPHTVTLSLKRKGK